jgi:N-succinyldiaminopimelate aminotransferase
VTVIHPDRDRARERAGRLDAYGTTVFAEMSALAVEHRAVNLGQGFPDEPGPPEVLEAALAAISAGHNQYAPGRGVPELLDAVSQHARRYYGQSLDPEREILVTAGATEAIAASVLALTGPGDEVVTFEPFYDSYAATIDLAGARRKVVRLSPEDWSFDPEELRRAVTGATRLILLNTPHNPTGRIFSHEELQLVADICLERDLLCVTDEVYEHLVFDDEGARPHERIATFDGMADRTVTISSAGKTFSVTGWKIGWAIAPPPLLESVKAVKQFLTFTSGTPLQLAVAAGLRLPPERLDAVRAALQQRRDRFCAGLEAIGWPVRRPEATYFATVDIGGLDLRPLGLGEQPDARNVCRALATKPGVAAIPLSAFYGPEHESDGRHLVRFAFSKREEVLDEALRRLRPLTV